MKFISASLNRPLCTTNAFTGVETRRFKVYSFDKLGKHPDVMYEKSEKATGHVWLDSNATFQDIVKALRTGGLIPKNARTKSFITTGSDTYFRVVKARTWEPIFELEVG